MSGIEDVRKVVQDLVAPDLKAIDGRLTGLEKSMNARADAIVTRLDASEQVSRARHDALVAALKALEGKVDSNHAAVLHALDIDKRLERLESQSADRRAELSRSA